MARILSIDYGTKRTGIAVTDPLRIIATALETVDSEKLMNFLASYFQKEPVDQLVVGMPKSLNNEDTDMTPFVRQLVEQLNLRFPDKPVALIDERFTSAPATIGKNAKQPWFECFALYVIGKCAIHADEGVLNCLFRIRPARQHVQSEPQTARVIGIHECGKCAHVAVHVRPEQGETDRQESKGAHAEQQHPVEDDAQEETATKERRH